MDPLAELVKIDPKSIGVGQYQHDVDQGRLKDNLDETVMSCVNEVGVKVNTASQQLLAYVSDLGSTLVKPGLDPREHFEVVAFAPDIRTIDQLVPGMNLTGIVTNVTNFGAFVDICIHQDGLVHISELSDKFVKKPADFVRVNQQVTVTVLMTDPERKRIYLSMRSDAPTPEQPEADIQ